MRAKLFGLFVVLAIFGAMSAPSVSAETTDEAYYTGQINVLFDFTVKAQVAFQEHMQEAEETDEWITTMIAMCRSWVMFEEVAKNLDPPRGWDGVQENVELSFEHMVTAGELFEESVLEFDEDLLDEAWAELTESAKYTTLASEEMQELQD